MVALANAVAVALAASQAAGDAVGGEGSCCFGLQSCAKKNPLSCPALPACQSETACLTTCSTKVKAKWCPAVAPGPPPPPFAPSLANMTVYRITPQNYSGVSNMNTGDAAGDAFFGLYELSIPVRWPKTATKTTN